jgi:hypothetical protein
MFTATARCQGVTARPVNGIADRRLRVWLVREIYNVGDHSFIQAQIDTSVTRIIILFLRRSTKMIVIEPILIWPMLVPADRVVVTVTHALTKMVYTRYLFVCTASKCDAVLTAYTMLQVCIYTSEPL